MIEQKMVDHLFRHQYGKMVAILTRLFGLDHLETIEDAIQDTFIKALKAWRTQMPENPEAWLTTASKNRAIDLLRKIKADDTRVNKIGKGSIVTNIDELFLDHEIEDAQLRMIFAACHPALNPRDQIAFALKTMAGFGTNEIASALLLKKETIKKRLTRARKNIKEQAISFEIPDAKQLPDRLARVLEVIYLTFNEGFHSNNQKILIRQELCGEAIRLCGLVLKNKKTATENVHALFALMCFHAARLESRIDDAGNIIDLKNQDRSKWHFPLIQLGDQMMIKAVEKGKYSSYHYEAAIAAEHLSATSFETTDWNRILGFYDQLYKLQYSAFALLNKAIVLIQLERWEEATAVLDEIAPDELEQRAYLYHGTLAELFTQTNQKELALEQYDKAIALVTNEAESAYLKQKKKIATS